MYMSRRRLKELPSIEIPVTDVSDAQQRGNEAVGNGHYVKVRKKNDYPIYGTWRCIFEEFDDRLKECRRQGIQIDEGVAYFLANQTDKAEAKQKKDKKTGNPIRWNDGSLVFELIRVGCRVRMLQEEMAKQYPCSLSHMKAQIALLKKHGFIVNSGNGWIEFDCRLVWYGDLRFLSGYMLVLEQEALGTENTPSFG